MLRRIAGEDLTHRQRGPGVEGNGLGSEVGGDTGPALDMRATIAHASPTALAALIRKG